MSELVELSSLDLRYEGYRLRDDAREARVLSSIAERGIEEPLAGVTRPPAACCWTVSNAAGARRSWGWMRCPTCRWVKRRRWAS